MLTPSLSPVLTKASPNGTAQNAAPMLSTQMHPAISFGADAPQSPPASPKTAQSQSFLERAKGFIQGAVQFLKRVLGVFDGGYQAVSVILHAKQWSAALGEGNPERGLDEKTMAIADLAYLAFRKGFYPNKSKDQLEGNPVAQQSYAANYALSSQLLFQYPGLLKVYDKLPGGLKLIEDCISSHPAFSDEEKQGKLAQLVPGKFASLTTQGCTDALSGLLLAEGPSGS
jgi:hypothetical protein